MILSLGLILLSLQLQLLDMHWCVVGVAVAGGGVVVEGSNTWILQKAAATLRKVQPISQAAILENFSVLTPGEKPPCTPGWTNHIQVTRRNRILGSYFCFKNNWDQLNRTEFGYVDVRCWNFCGNGLV